MWLVIIFFIFIMGLLIYLDSRKPDCFPPGPKWFPILGSALEIQRLRTKTGYLFKAINVLGANYKTPILGLKVGKDRIVICLDIHSSRELLARNEFDGRPHGPFYETRTWGERRGVLLTDGNFWQDQRRFVLRQLREFGFGKQSMGELIEAEAQHLLNAIENKAKDTKNNVMQMDDIFAVFVLNTLWYMMAGIRYSSEDTELVKLQSLLTELFANIDMVGCLFSQYPVLRFLAPEMSGYKNFIYIHQRIWEFLKAELEKHKATFESGYSRDFMDVYLKELSSKSRKESFSESQLLAICMDMFMAGTETTAKTLGFCFFYLVRCQHVQKRVQKEIDDVIGRDRMPRLEDRKQMPYTEATVLESLRVFTARAFSIPHRALKDTELCGYFIPKDTMILCNFNGILMDPNIWKDPEEFNPDRFLDSEGQLSIPEQFAPFGLGKHRCIGEKLAKANIFVFMTTLLQRLNFLIPPGEELSEAKFIDGATPSTGFFNALVVPRERDY